MKSLAAQVKAFMEWKSMGGHPYGPTDLARDVAAYQGKLEAAKRCKRQDIENLLKKELARPRYLPELAKAMDTTAEVLASGRYIPGFSKVLKLNELNDHEGQLVLMFRELPPEVQDHVLEEMNKLYVKAHPAASPANPWANAPAPGAPKVGANGILLDGLGDYQVGSSGVVMVQNPATRGAPAFGVGSSNNRTGKQLSGKAIYVTEE